VPAAGSCTDCPRRTGHNKLLFSDLGKLDACTAPSCYQAKVDAQVAKTIAAKPKLVQISTAYGQQKEGGATLPRNKYTEIRPDKPANKEQATRPEFKTCKYTTEAIVSEGIDKGELRKVCAESTCPVHHPKSRPQQYSSKSRFFHYQHEQAYLLAKGRPPMPKQPLSDGVAMPYSGNKLHPTQKPVTALFPLICTFTLPGELVLDPFAGSGSTCAAALLANRRFIGTELDDVYCEAATARIVRVQTRIAAKRCGGPAGSENRENSWSLKTPMAS
jgi:hypothetical protein